jgi:hypothetical protein
LKPHCTGADQRKARGKNLKTVLGVGASNTKSHCFFQKFFVYFFTLFILYKKEAMEWAKIRAGNATSAIFSTSLKEEAQKLIVGRYPDILSQYSELRYKVNEAGKCPESHFRGRVDVEVQKLVVGAYPDILSRCP